MEISTIIGLVLGVVALIVGMFLKGAPIDSLIRNPAAFVIIFGGTAATLFVAFPLSELKKFPKLIKMTMTKPKMISKGELIKLFMEWATITRREGLLALESKVDEIDDDFLRGGMRMIIDGNDQDFVQDVLTEDIAATEERHKAGAMIFSQAGMYAPTLGVLGAVIGLIAALSDMSNVEILSHAISGAFIATIFGIFTGYVMWHPIATKLKRLSKREMEVRLMMVEGLLSIQSGVSTIAIQQKLAVFLTPAERAQILEKGRVKVSKKSKRHQDHEEHADESWLLPYSDLMTLLLAMFIVLFGMSSVDSQKFQEMSDAFNSVLTGGRGVLDHNSMINKNDKTGMVTEDVTKALNKKMNDLKRQEEENLEALKKRLDKYIENNGLTDQLDTKLNQSQLMITISDIALFPSGEADVKPEARILAKAIAKMLEEFPDYEVIVSGHTDNVPISTNKFRDNWDLSSVRALNFMKILLLDDKLDPKLFIATGNGEYRPVASNDTNVGRAQNRRVEVSIIRKYQDSNVIEVKPVN